MISDSKLEFPIMNHFSGVFHHSLSLINLKSVQRNPDFLMRLYVNTERSVNNNVSLAADNKTTQRIDSYLDSLVEKQFAYWLFPAVE